MLDDLRADPRYVLAIGSMVDGAARNQQLAHNFLDEARDRGLNPHTPGVMLLGMIHAAAAPFREADEMTTRMLLQRRGYRCVSIVVITDFAADNGSDDAVLVDPPFASTATGGVDPIRLTDLVDTTPVMVPTDRQSVVEPPSPFRHVSFDGSASPLAAQYEYLVLHKA